MSHTTSTHTSLSLSSLAHPYHALCQAPHAVVPIAPIAGRLHTSDATLQLGPNAQAHLLLAAASAAASARKSLPAAAPKTTSGDEPDGRRALESIHGAVLEELQASVRTDAPWRELHFNAGSSSRDKWAAMPHEQRVAWVGHHAGLDSSSLAQESKADYAHHEAHALEMLRREHFTRHPDFSSVSEERATNQVVAALRAAMGS